MLYEPQEDSYQLEKEVKKYAFGRVLDVGTGSGIQAKAALTKSKDVTGVDLDKESLDYCKENHKGIKFVFSDLFSKVKGKFDTIIFNPPYLPQDEGIEDIALYGGKKGHEVVERFLDDVSTYLSKDGIILLLFSSLTTKDKVDEIIARNLFDFKELSKEKHFFEELYVYKLEKKEILKKMEDVGVSEVEYLAKGRRGLVYSGVYKKKKSVIKIKNPESTAGARIEIEGKYLKKVNLEGIGPKLYFCDKDMIIEEK